MCYLLIHYKLSSCFYMYFYNHKNNIASIIFVIYILHSGGSVLVALLECLDYNQNDPTI